MFLNENDLFEIRLNQHWNFVDKFIVIESKETHSGLSKPLNFDHERFKPYSEKIEYRVIENLGDEMKKYPHLDCSLGRQVHRNNVVFARDHFQINYIHKVLQDLNAIDTDIVYVSSMDEIICQESFNRAMIQFEDKDALYVGRDWQTGREIMKDFRPCMGFHLYLYIYKFNLLRLKATDHVAAMITEVGNFKKMLPGTIRSVGCVTHAHISDGGWHFSYADKTDGDMVMTKLKSWAHCNDPWVGGVMRSQVTDKTDALSKLDQEHPTTLVPIQYGTHPAYMVDNIDKFQDYIFKE
jgi:beta-1,4-mannosyl-glycoprotein beta-1,4-N-acetylglucosaminyltransferase